MVGQMKTPGVDIVESQPCFECGSTERIGTACAKCNPEITDPNFGMGKNEWFARIEKYTRTVEKIHNPNSDILHEAWSAEGGAYLRLADLKQLVDAVGLFGVNRHLTRMAINDFIMDELREVAKIEGEVVTMPYGSLWNAAYEIAGKIFKGKVPQVSSPDVPMVVETTEGENVFLEQARYALRVQAREYPDQAGFLNKLADACRRAAIRVERPSKREEDLEEALDLALRMLVKYEPEDSRAVSDEYVAMAALISGIEPNEPGDEMQIIRAARERMIKEDNNV